MATYSIYEGNMERLEKKMTRIKNKCEKYGCEFTFRRTGEEFRTVKTEKGEVTLKFILVEASGKAIMHDWQFIAEVERTDKGNIINRATDIEVPARYYNSPCQCEHCNTSRARKYTYIVRNTQTGEFKQVGKACLKDFTYGMSAEGVAEIMDGVDELIKGETPCEGSGYGIYTPVREMLLFFAETIRHFGYVRNTWENGGNSTAQRAGEFYRAFYNIGGLWAAERNKEVREEMSRIGFDHTREDIAEKVDAALDWIAEQPEENNYMHNLKTACTCRYIPETGYALVASLLPTFDRELEYQAIKAEREAKAKAEKAAGAVSEYQGKVGDKISATITGVKCVTGFDTQFGYMYIYKFVDDSGNIYIWKTGKRIDTDHDWKSITGTVKEHSEFREIKQTVLTRCKIA